MKICVVPGSFDPFTIGHLDVVERASKLFDKVYVAIMVNSSKNGTFDFSTRKKIATASCAEIKNVEVITADGLLCDLVKALGASAIVKGVRNSIDFEYEMNLVGMNRLIDSSVETVFLPSKPAYSAISSSFVREMMKYERPIIGLVHPDTIKIIDSVKK